MTLGVSLTVCPSVQKRVCQLRLCAVILGGLLVILSCSLILVDLTHLLLIAAPLLERAGISVRSYLLMLLRMLTKLLVWCVRVARVVVSSVASAGLLKVFKLGISSLHSTSEMDSLM